MKLRLPISIGLCLSLAATAQAQWADVGANPLTSTTATYTNLVKDNSGNYYVSYYGGGQASGSVQKYNGTGWSPLGGSLGVTPGTATFNALCVNNSGEVYYSFQDGSNSSGLSVKKYTPATNAWTDAGINISGGVVNYQNLKIIPSTNLPIAVYNSSGIKAKRYNGTAWVEVGASPVVSGAGANHAMAVGTNDTVYVAVQVGTAYSVYKNHINATTTDAWQLVGNAGFTSGGSSNQFTVSLAIDGNNKLYMAYRALATPDGSKAAVYKYDAGNWSALGNLHFSDYGVEHISIAVTAAGVPTVAFRENNPTDKTKVYTLNGTSWNSLGTASANLGNYNSLVLDNGAPVVAFCDGTGTNGGLVKIRKYTPSVITLDSIDVKTVGNVAAAITANGGTLPMEAVFYPATFGNQAVTWSIVPVTGGASISSSGVVTATANGTVYAKAIAAANTAIKDSLLITISNQVVLADSLDVITQNNVPATITTNAGTLQMATQFYPANTTNQSVTWSIVAGTGAASISGSGLVTAISNGTVYAKAVSVANPLLMDSLQLTISGQTISVDSIVVQTANNVAAAISTNGGTLQMEALVYPNNATNQDVNWSIVPVSGTATIDANGLVTAQTNGTVYAKAVSVANNSLMDSVLITISNQGTGINNHFINQHFSVYPSPVADRLTVASTLTGSYSYQVYNVSGQLLLKEKATGNAQVNVSAFANGLYSILILTDQGASGVIRFVKQ
ncbi:MAG: Ig-like domain-containing protein [Taibaiella sp.]|nr:Ig-like domain-containing protein [Taibaiella sp.]